MRGRNSTQKKTLPLFQEETVFVTSDLILPFFPESGYKLEW